VINKCHRCRICFDGVMDFLKIPTSLLTRLAAETYLADRELL